MNSLTIRKIDQQTKIQLRIRAAQHGLSMEQEVRNIITEALKQEAKPTSINIGQAIHQRFANVGGVELGEIKREPLKAPIFL